MLLCLVSLLEDVDHQGIPELSQHFILVLHFSQEDMDMMQEFWSSFLEDFCWNPTWSLGFVVAQFPDGSQELIFSCWVIQMLLDETLRDLADGFRLDCGVPVSELLEVFLPPATAANIILQQCFSVFGVERV